MISVRVISKEEWSSLSQDTHTIMFNENRPSSKDRIDFALISFNGLNPFGYISCKELDSESIYWQFGGVFKEMRGVHTLHAVLKCLEIMKPLYKRVCVNVKNDNIPMLRILLKTGFLIDGVRNFGSNVLLHLTRAL